MSYVAMALAVYGAYESNRSRRAGNRQMEADRKQTDAQLAEQRQRQAILDRFGQPLTEHGMQNLNMVQSRLRTLVGGDRNMMTQQVADEINALNEQSRGAVQAQRNLMPRGGMGAAASANIPDQNQAAINNLLFQSRRDATQQLGALGTNQAQLGLGALGSAAGLSNNMLDFGLRSRDQMFQQGMAAGQGYMGALQGLGQAWGSAYSAWNTPKTPPATTNPSSMPNQNILNNFGQGSTLGFGRTSPTPSTATGGPMSQWGISSVYTPAGSNIYSGKST